MALAMHLIDGIDQFSLKGRPALTYPRCGEHQSVWDLLAASRSLLGLRSGHDTSRGRLIRHRQAVATIANASSAPTNSRHHQQRSLHETLIHCLEMGIVDSIVHIDTLNGVLHHQIH
jgi:uncharacterized membrane protein YccC